MGRGGLELGAFQWEQVGHGDIAVRAFGHRANGLALPRVARLGFKRRSDISEVRFRGVRYGMPSLSRSYSPSTASTSGTQRAMRSLIIPPRRSRALLEAGYRSLSAGPYCLTMR